MSKKTTETVIAYKGFDKNLRCRGYQYAIGQTFTHDGPVKQCESGFHACQNPLDVLDFYGLEDGNRFARVTLGGKIDRSDDRKWAAEEITVTAELKLPDLIADAIKFVRDACGKGVDGAQSASGDYSQLAASGDYSKLAASGDSSQLEISGANSAAAAVGACSSVKAAAGCPVAICEYDATGTPIGFATGIAGKGGVPADTWLIAKDGKLVAA